MTDVIPKPLTNPKGPVPVCTQQSSAVFSVRPTRWARKRTGTTFRFEARAGRRISLLASESACRGCVRPAVGHRHWSWARAPRPRCQADLEQQKAGRGVVRELEAAARARRRCRCQRLRPIKAPAACAKVRRPGGGAPVRQQGRRCPGAASWARAAPGDSTLSFLLDR